MLCEIYFRSKTDNFDTITVVLVRDNLLTAIEDAKKHVNLNAYEYSGEYDLHDSSDAILSYYTGY